MRLLAAPRDNVLAVGDDDQAIYSWRGADISHILSFPEKFTRCTRVVLDKNYRSTENILGGATAVIHHNRHRTPKTVPAAAGRGEPILHFVGDDEEEEATWIADTINFHHTHSHFSFKDHAILLRTNALMRRFETGLRAQKVPYKVSGALSFFERKEIKDIVSYLRFFSNPSDELSLMRVLKVPDKGIAPFTLEALDDLAAQRKMGLWEAVLGHAQCANLQPAQAAKLVAFCEFHKKHLSALVPGKLAASFRELLDDCGYLGALRRASRDDAEYQERVANVEELLHGLETYEVKAGARGASLTRFLQEMALTASDDEEDDSKKRGVTLMTLHKSKGLEFPVVFLAGLDRDVIPSPRAVEEGGIEEERRLFYVGMTRAKKKLYLTYPATKVFYSKQRKVIPSPFLYEIPEEFLDGKIGAQQQQDKEEYMGRFFEEMKARLAGKAILTPADPVTAGPGQKTDLP